MKLRKMFYVEEEVYQDFKTLASKKGLKLTFYIGQLISNEVKKNIPIIKGE